MNDYTIEPPLTIHHRQTPRLYVEHAQLALGQKSSAREERHVLTAPRGVLSVYISPGNGSGLNTQQKHNGLSLVQRPRVRTLTVEKVLSETWRRRPRQV